MDFKPAQQVTTIDGSYSGRILVERVGDGNRVVSWRNFTNGIDVIPVWAVWNADTGEVRFFEEEYLKPA